jgi:hypothetical protein
MFVQRQHFLENMVLCQTLYCKLQAKIASRNMDIIMVGFWRLVCTSPKIVLHPPPQDILHLPGDFLLGADLASFVRGGGGFHLFVKSVLAVRSGLPYWCKNIFSPTRKSIVSI